MELKLLRFLCYFDVFNHPLSVDELKALAHEEDDQVIHTALDSLLEKGDIFCQDKLYGIRETITEQIQIRTEKENRAQSYYVKLPRYLRLIKAFPFVRGVAISGSLSKNVMPEDGDIDYFIITAANRLWICRTLLILFKKVFLLNSRKYFCLNYFVDENNLEIIDKNMFTAIEIKSLITVYNSELLTQTQQQNAWTQEFVPGELSHSKLLPLEPAKSFSLKKIPELFFFGSFGDRIDLFFMKKTYKRWQKKFQNFDTAKFELTMRTNRGVSKHHPRDFQSKVLKEYQARIDKFESIR